MDEKYKGTYAVTVRVRFPVPETRKYSQMKDGTIKDNCLFLIEKSRTVMIPLDNIIDVIFEKEN